MDDHDEENRTERNLIVHSGKSETEVTNSRRLCSTLRRIVQLKLATDRHEASRGLSATAGLLVSILVSTRILKS